jgi:Ca-activated chloride channel family protein
MAAHIKHGEPLLPTLHRRHRASRLSVCFVGAIAAVLILITLPGVAAQTPSFKTHIDTVTVTVTVTDASGRLITDLGKDDFEVAEDGTPQPVTQFTAERVPVSLGILLDDSDSMRGRRIVDARGAFDRFVGDLLEPEDEAFAATFNHAPRMVAPWKRPPSALAHALDQVRPSGGTAIYDALVAFTPMLDRRRNVRAAIVVISDGADTASDRTLTQAREIIRRTDAFVYAIAIDEPDGRESTRVNPEALRDITGPSGGYTEVVKNAADLVPATDRSADELNHQYTLGYVASRPPDGTWRNIRVRVRTHDDYRTRARRGSYADPAKS